jgi:threonine aldolase
MDLDALAQAVREPTRHNFGTALVCMETTHNRAGGAVLPLAHMEAVSTIAHKRGVPVHVDGARIFNAAAALAVPAREIARFADSVSFCVSKGLSAPIGSILCGSQPFVERARAFRRMVGGNMRQAGPLAAAGIVALETMVARLAEDHATARRLAAGLGAIDPDLTDPGDVESNIVRINVKSSGWTAARWATALAGEGVAVAPADDHALRFVTHRHIGAADVDATVAAFSRLWSKRFALAN